MSVELVDKGVSTEDLENIENVEEKEIQKQNPKEKEKKETANLDKLEVILSALVENKIMSIRNYGKRVKEKKHLFSKFRSKSEEVNNFQSDNQETKTCVNSSSTLVSHCKCSCHRYGHKSIIPCESAEFCQPKISNCPQSSMESSHQLNIMCPQQSFESYDPSPFCKSSSPDNICCTHKTEVDQRLDRKKLAVQKCLPKRLTTEQWLNSTSRQTSTETATTSSGYISPTFGTGTRRHRSHLTELDTHQIDISMETGHDVDNETIIEMSKIQAQKTLDEIEECEPVEKTAVGPKSFNYTSINELEHIKVNNSSAKDARTMCDDPCHVIMPQCVSTTCIPSCKYSLVEEKGCCTIAPYRHLHPSGGHYVSCCNSPTHSFQRFHYDDNYLTLAMNLEDLEFEQEEERRKRRKRRKKRRKERQARARGLMADELKNVKAAKVLDPEDLPKRARWTIVATACLLLLMSMLLVGVTLRMAPIIDEMVRKENEEMLNSLSRQGAIKEATWNTTKAPTLENSSNRL